LVDRCAVLLSVHAGAALVPSTRATTLYLLYYYYYFISQHI
jgi:hypothetical protein